MHNAFAQLLAVCICTFADRLSRLPDPGVACGPSNADNTCCTQLAVSVPQRHSQELCRPTQAVHAASQPMSKTRRKDGVAVAAGGGDAAA